MGRLFLGSLLSLLIVVGCHSRRKGDEAPPLATAVAIEGESGEWPEPDFWEMYGDPQLSSLVTRALRDAPSLLAVRARVEEATQKALQVRAGMFPEIGARFDTNWEHMSRDSLLRFPPSFLPSVYNQTTVALDFSYEFDFWGKNRNAFRAALGAAFADRAESAEADLMLASALCDAYFALHVATQYESLWTEIAESRREIASLVRLKESYALADSIAVAKEEGRFLEAEESLSAARNTSREARYRIHFLLGIGPDAELELRAPSLACNDGRYALPSSLPLDLMSRRPDLIARLYRATAAAYEIGVAKTAFYPNIDLTAFIGLQSLTWSSLLNADSYMAGMRPALHLPIFTAGKLTAQLRGKEAAYTAAVHDYNDGVLKAAQQVATSSSALKTATEQLGLASGRLARAQIVEHLTHLRLLSNLDSQLDLLRSRDARLMQQLDLARIEYDQLVASLMVVKALGGGYRCE